MEALENTFENGGGSEEDVSRVAAESGNISTSPVTGDLYGEVGELAQYMNDMVGKLQDAGSMMESVSGELPFGTNELDEARTKTEEATQKILDDADKVIDNSDAMTVRLDSLKATLFDEKLGAEGKVKEDIKALCALLEENKSTMFNLMGTLSFQDPVGQQIRKVSSMLKGFQARILKMVVTFGHGTRGAVVTENRQEEILSEIDYSNEGEALDQDLVDSVLKEYGF